MIDGLAEKDEETPDYAGHRDRLRQRFLAAPDALPDYELLELLLHLAIPRRDTKPLAKALMKHFNDSFAAVISAEPGELLAVKGVGETSLAALKMVREAAVRLTRAPVANQPILSNWEALLDYCQAKIGLARIEEFHLLFLDRKNRLIRDEAQQKGTVDHTPVYPREVVRRALELQASAIIMVHNHPSGDPTPSRADIDMTRQVRDALKVVGVTLHDHLIIGRGGHRSFKATGLL